LQLKRKEGNTICIPSNENTKLFINDNKNLLVFLLSMIFLSVFIYLFPMGQLKSPLDNSIHMFTCVLPLIALLMVLKHNVSKKRT